VAEELGVLFTVLIVGYWDAGHVSRVSVRDWDRKTVGGGQNDVVSAGMDS
jgi:hypothetical protein